MRHTIIAVSSKQNLVLLIIAVVFLTAGSTSAGISWTHIANGSSGYLNETVSMYINPARTNWVAWHDQTTPTIHEGKEYVGDVAWIGVDDFFTLTITNPSGATLGGRMDYNDAWAVSSGPQAVIYGTAADSPDVTRWGASWSPSYYPRSPYIKIFDEPGAFNSIFTTAGTYSFEFVSGNTGSTYVSYPDMYLLADIEPVATVPAPSAMVLGLIGLGAINSRLRRRHKA